MATSSGISVISTRFARRIPIAPPMIIATRIQATLPVSGPKMVASKAIAIPAMPKLFPRCDVSCLESPARLKINRIAATMYAAVTNPPDICYPLAFTKHFQHALSHGETTENIDTGDQHRNEAQEADPAAMTNLQQCPDHDNPGDGIGDRHQRGMQRMRNVPHDVVTHHAGEREDGEVAKELFWRDIRQPAKQDNNQRHDGVFAPRRRRFCWL